MTGLPQINELDCGDVVHFVFEKNGNVVVSKDPQNGGTATTVKEPTKAIEELAQKNLPKTGANSEANFKMAALIGFVTLGSGLFLIYRNKKSAKLMVLAFMLGGAGFVSQTDVSAISNMFNTIYTATTSELQSPHLDGYTYVGYWIEDGACELPDKSTSKITIEYKTEDGKVLKVPNIVSSKIGTDFNIEKDTPEEIEVDGKLYSKVKVDGNTSGKTPNTDTTVTVTYKEVKGKVTVSLSLEDGTIISTEEVEGSVFSDYDVTDKIPDKFEKDGKTYIRINIDGNTRGKISKDNPPVTGKYKELEKGNGFVTVKLIDENGEVIVSENIEGKIDDEYEVTDKIPEKIEVNEKIYKKINIDGNTTGKITKENISVIGNYKEEDKGKVTITLKTEDGTVITTYEKEDYINKDFDVTDKIPNRFEKDGKTYVRINIDGNITGTITKEGTLTVTETYKEVKGKITVNLTTPDGTPIVTEEIDGEINQDYDVTDKIPNRFEKNGKVYERVNVDGDTSGKIAEGNTNVTGTYREVKGKITVNLTTSDGTSISTEEVEGSINSDYDVSEKIPNRLEKDGKVYERITVDGDTIGKITEDKTNITGTYREKKGVIVVTLTADDGVTLSTEEVTDSINRNYDVTEKVPSRLEKDNKVYERVNIEGNIMGTVTEDNTNVSGTYKLLKGKVTVTLTTPEGETLLTEEVEGAINDDYDVTEKVPNRFEHNGKIYVKHNEETPNLTGKITEVPITITPIYEELKGNVTIFYKNPDGEEIKSPVVISGIVGEEANIEDETPNRFEHNGKIYVKVPNEQTNPTITEESINIETEYEELKGKVAIAIVDDKGTPIKTEEIESFVNDNYDVTDKLPQKLEFNGKLYNKLNQEGNSTGVITEQTTSIQATYEEVQGNVVISFNSPNGNPIKSETITGSVGDNYDVTNKVPDKFEHNGKLYRKVENTNEKLTGKIGEESTNISVTYEEVPAKVIITYLDEKGATIKTDEINDNVGNPYNATDKLPDRFEHNGKTYVKVDVVGNVNGSLTEEDTPITANYRTLNSMVTLNIVDENNDTIKTEEVNSFVGDNYNLINKLPDRLTHEGKTYIKNNVEGNVEGTITENPIHVKGKYTKLTGKVTTTFITPEGEPIKTEEITGDVGDTYNLTEKVPERFEHNGKTYVKVEVDNTEGTITEENTNVTAKYNVLNGKVILNIKTENDNPIKTEEVNSFVGDNYNLDNFLPERLEHNNRLYTKVNVDNDSQGKVKEQDTIVNATYEEVQGTVNLNFVTPEGTPIKSETVTGSVGDNYDVTNKVPDRFEHNGKVYVKTTDPIDNTTGTITENPITITPKYEELQGTVNLNFTTPEGTPIKTETVTGSVGDNYNVTNKIPNRFEHNGKVYIKTSDPIDNTTGTIAESPITVNPKYEELQGTVNLNFTTPEGTPIKSETVTDSVGNNYNLADKLPERFTHEGKTYVKVEVEGNENGPITEEDTNVTAKYRVLNGKVVLKKQKENGEIIETTEHSSFVGDSYNLENSFPTTISHQGKDYNRLSIDRDTSGTITEEDTNITATYKEADVISDRTVTKTVNRVIEHMSDGGKNLNNLVTNNQPDTAIQPDTAMTASITVNYKFNETTGKVVSITNTTNNSSTSTNKYIYKDFDDRENHMNYRHLRTQTNSSTVEAGDILNITVELVDGELVYKLNGGEFVDTLTETTIWLASPEPYTEHKFFKETRLEIRHITKEGEDITDLVNTNIPIPENDEIVSSETVTYKKYEITGEIFDINKNHSGASSVTEWHAFENENYIYRIDEDDPRNDNLSSISIDVTSEVSPDGTVTFKTGDGPYVETVTFTRVWDKIENEPTDDGTDGLEQDL